MEVWEAPTSVEWIPWFRATIALPLSMRARASSSLSVRGSARRRLARRISSRRAMFASEVIVTTRNGLPSVVAPTFSTLTRGEAAASFWKYPTICVQSASLRSSPTRKPSTDSGDGTSAETAGRAAAAHSRRARQGAAKRRVISVS